MINETLSSFASIRSNSICERRFFEAGCLVFRQGDVSDCFYLLQSGMVDILFDQEGETRLLGRLKPGSIFGEMAAIDGAPRMASAKVVESAEIAVFRRDHLQMQLAKTPPFIRAVLRTVLENARINNSVNKG